MFLFLCFFFFQAEDGIRDTSVTGVQTCALPISRLVTERVRVEPGRARRAAVVERLAHLGGHEGRFASRVGNDVSVDGRHQGRRSLDRKSTRLNSSHRCTSYAVFCLKKKKKNSAF